MYLAEARTRRDHERAFRGLVGALADPAPEVRAAVATSLERLADPRAAGHVAARLQAEREARVLSALLLALGKTDRAGTWAGLAVTYARSHPLASVRAAAVTALAELGGPTARAVALELVGGPHVPDPDWSLRSAAMLALSKCGQASDVGTALVAYREGGGRHHWFARCALAELLAAKDVQPMPGLHRLVQDDDPRVALTAAIGIVRRGSEEETSALLRHTSPGVRVAAATAVGREQKEALYGRLRNLARFDRARRVRWAASLALFAVEDPSGDELVLAGLSSREPVVWAEAIAALAARTNENHARDLDAWRDALRRARAER